MVDSRQTQVEAPLRACRKPFLCITVAAIMSGAVIVHGIDHIFKVNIFKFSLAAVSLSLRTFMAYIFTHIF
jgi:hypothetical protein